MRMVKGGGEEELGGVGRSSGNAAANYRHHLLKVTQGHLSSLGIEIRFAWCQSS